MSTTPATPITPTPSSHGALGYISWILNLVPELVVDVENIIAAIKAKMGGAIATAIIATADQVADAASPGNAATADQAASVADNAIATIAG